MDNKVTILIWFSLISIVRINGEPPVHFAPAAFHSGSNIHSGPSFGYSSGHTSNYQHLAPVAIHLAEKPTIGVSYSPAVHGGHVSLAAPSHSPVTSYSSHTMYTNHGAHSMAPSHAYSMPATVHGGSHGGSAHSNSFQSYTAIPVFVSSGHGSFAPSVMHSSGGSGGLGMYASHSIAAGYHAQQPAHITGGHSAGSHGGATSYQHVSKTIHKSTPVVAMKTIATPILASFSDHGHAAPLAYDFHQTAPSYSLISHH